MKKTITLTALTAVLALGLSGCTLDLAAPRPAPQNQTGKPAEVEATETATDDVPYTEKVLQECVAGEPVSITEDEANVEFTGVCGDVTITGNYVSANFADAGNVSISGENASVGFTGTVLDVSVVGSWNMVFGNAMGAINVAGSYNSVSATVATAVTVAGSDNSVSWQTGAADGTDTGNGNALTRPTP